MVKKSKSKKTVQAQQHRESILKKLEENQISLISFQQSIGGSLAIFSKDRLADTDDNFFMVGDEDIVIPEVHW